jgi:hypothetical protein
MDEDPDSKAKIVFAFNQEKVFSRSAALLRFLISYFTGFLEMVMGSDKASSASLDVARITFAITVIVNSCAIVCHLRALLLRCFSSLLLPEFSRLYVSHRKRTGRQLDCIFYHFLPGLSIAIDVLVHSRSCDHFITIFACAHLHQSSQGVLALFSSSSAAIANPSQPDAIFIVTMTSLGHSIILYVSMIHPKFDVLSLQTATSSLSI